MTDNGNEILDIHGLRIDEPVAAGEPHQPDHGRRHGGLFAARPADLLLVGGAGGVREFPAPGLEAGGRNRCAADLADRGSAC